MSDETREFWKGLLYVNHFDFRYDRAVQKHLKGVDDSVLEAHDGVRLFQLSQNSPTQENKKEKNRCQFFGT